MISPKGGNFNAIWHPFLTERNDTIAHRNSESGHISQGDRKTTLRYQSISMRAISLSNRVLSLCVCTTRRTRRHHVPGRCACLPPVMAYPVIANTPPVSFITPATDGVTLTPTVLTVRGAGATRLGMSADSRLVEATARPERDHDVPDGRHYPERCRGPSKEPRPPPRSAELVWWLRWRSCGRGNSGRPAERPPPSHPRRQATLRRSSPSQTSPT